MKIRVIVCTSLFLLVGKWGMTQEKEKRNTYYQHMNKSVLLGRDGDHQLLSAGFQFVNGYIVDDHIKVGLGVGIEALYFPVAPLFLEGRYQLSNGLNSPYARIYGGYAIPVVNDQIYYEGRKMRYEGGALAGGALGMRKGITERISFTFEVGFRYQRLQENRAYYWYDIDSEYNPEIYDVIKANRLVISVGFLLH